MTSIVPPARDRKAETMGKTRSRNRVEQVARQSSTTVIPADAGSPGVLHELPQWVGKGRVVNWRGPSLPSIIDLEAKKRRTGNGTRIAVFRIGGPEVIPDGEGTNAIEAHHLVCCFAFDLKQLTLQRSAKSELAQAILRASPTPPRWLRVIASERAELPEFFSQERLLGLRQILTETTTGTRSLADDLSGITLQVLSDSDAVLALRSIGRQNLPADLTRLVDLREPPPMREGHDARGKRKTAKDALSPVGDPKNQINPEDLDLSGNSFGYEARAQRANALLKEFAQLREAGRQVGVSYTTIQNAVLTGKLTKFELAGGCVVVSLSECRKMWESGGQVGRPRKS